MNRWDEIRYIDFFDALKTIRENKDLFVEDPVLKNWVNNEKNLKTWLKFTNGQAMQSMQFQNIENFLVF